MVMQKGKQEEEGAVMGEFSEGGGLFGSNGVDGDWIKLRYQMWDYPDGSATAPVLMISIQTDDGEIHEEPNTCGGADFWKPSKDGHKIIPKSTAIAISPKSKTGLLMKSLLEAGYPEENDEGTGLKQIRDCTVLEGLRCHMIREPMPKGSVVSPKKPRADGRVFEDTYLAVDKILRFPWERKETTKEKGKAEDAMAQKTTEAVIAVLKANPKGLDPKKLAGQVFNKTKSMPVAQLAAKTDFLTEGAIEGNWSFEDGIVSPTEE